MKIPRLHIRSRVSHLKTSPRRFTLGTKTAQKALLSHSRQLIPPTVLIILVCLFHNFITYTRTSRIAYRAPLNPPSTTPPPGQTDRITGHFCSVSLATPAQAGQSRFERPWCWPPLACLPTLQQSRFRVVYSPLREKVHDGLGHILSQTAVEIGTALRLGATYVHRPLEAESLTREHPNVLDDFFGLALGAPTRRAIWKAACADGNETYPLRDECVPCKGFKSKRRGAMRIRRVVDVPLALSFRFRAEDLRHHRQAQRFAQKHALPNTMFRLSDGYCYGMNHFWRVFTPPVRSVFFHRFWALRKPEARHDTAYIEDERKRLSLHEDRIAIAVHVRRGDLLWGSIDYRHMVSLRVLTAAVAELRCIIWKTDGKVGRMPAMVYIFSEGRVHESGDNRTAHDVKMMDDVLVDSNGRMVEEAEMNGALRGAVRRRCGLKTEEVDEEVWRGISVELRVGRDTMLSVREMVSADVFVGTPSSLGSMVVDTLSRGVKLQPSTNFTVVDDVTVLYDEASGDFDGQVFAEMWRRYVEANNDSMLTAVSH